MECFKLHLMFSLKRSSKFFLFFVFLNSFLRVIGGEGGIRTNGTVTHTTAFKTVVQAQIGTGGRVNSRWLQAPATTVICTPLRLVQSWMSAG
jgi:hypothetical protein